MLQNIRVFGAVYWWSAPYPPHLERFIGGPPHIRPKVGRFIGGPPHIRPTLGRYIGGPLHSRPIWSGLLVVRLTSAPLWGGLLVVRSTAAPFGVVMERIYSGHGVVRPKPTLNGADMGRTTSCPPRFGAVNW